MLRGPDPERDGLSSWTAKDLCRLVEERFGVSYSENGMLDCCTGSACPGRRPGRSIRRPISRRSRHLKKFPTLIAEMAAAHPEAQGLKVWFLDEARVGQTGRACRRWFEKRQRPCGRRDLRHEAVYLCGAVCPERDTGVALVLPTVETTAMQLMLDELSQAVDAGAHGLVTWTAPAGTAPRISPFPPT